MSGVNKCSQIINEVNKIIIGKENIVKYVLAAIISGGHVLLEDIPGVGKTTLAMTFSKVLSLSYSRMQFTPDVMPSDVTGFNMYNKSTEKFEYREGVIMSNFFLADEINRTSSKTQSALLEAMEEKKVTVDGVTYPLKTPFVVIATQNPMGSVGTSMLPESQLDRFMMRLSMGYPDKSGEINMLKSKGSRDIISDNIQPVVSIQEVLDIQREVSQVYVHDDVYGYVVDISEATRKNEAIKLGISPRGSIAMVNAAKAAAYMAGRDYVVPDDVRNIVYPVANHRLILSGKAKLENMSTWQIISRILSEVRVTERK